jgi:serine/threonine-protein kinase
MGMRASGIAHFGVSANGLLAYIAGEPASRVERLVWLDHDGTTEPLPTPVDGYLDPRLSPDRKSIAVAVEGDSTFDIWVYDIERGTLTRLTFDGDNTWPSWSPDGKRIAFASVRDNASMSTYIKNADGSGEAELLYSPDVHENAGQATPGGWSPDGRTLLINFTDQKGSNILALDTEEGTTQMLLDSPAGEYGGHISPDGRWMVYSSDESGRFEIYVRPFPGHGGKWQISADGGGQPRWSHDGTRLFFRWLSEIRVVDVGTRGDRWQSGRPRQLLDGFPAATANYNYDVVDRDRFVIVQAEQDENRPLGVTVVVNWLDELRRRIPDE